MHFIFLNMKKEKRFCKIKNISSKKYNVINLNFLSNKKIKEMRTWNITGCEPRTTSRNKKRTFFSILNKNLFFVRTVKLG